MKFIATFAAVIGYGTWAYWANCNADMPDAVATAWRAAAIQGGYAGGLTLVNVYVLEILFNRLALYVSTVISGSMAVLSAMVAQYALIIPVHILNHTPNILMTLAPGLVIGTAFSITYVYNHSRQKKPVTF